MHMDQPYMDYGATEALDSAMLGVGGFILVFVVLFYLIMFAFAIASYILTASGMYTVARRRGVHHAWLAWIPVGDYWLLGSLADQYQYVAKGRVRNRRKVLLGLSLGMVAVFAVMFIGAFLMILSEVTSDAYEVLFGGAVAIMLLGYFAVLVLLIVLAVFFQIALYDFYASCDPDNAVLYLVLGILFSVATPFFIFACRKKDKGMPPKKEAPKEIPPVEVVENPVVETVAVTAEAPEEAILEAPAEETTEE